MGRRDMKETMKKKKGWRKINISELEKSLELSRLEERTGGLRSLKADTELFTIERKGESTIQPAVRPTLTLEEKLENLKCYLPLKSHSSVPAKPSGRPQKEVKNKRIKRLGGGVRKPSISAIKKLRVSKNIWSTGNEVKPKEKSNASRLPLIPAVPLPHPGTSYHPDSEEQQELLREEFEKELEDDARAFKEKRLEKQFSAANKVDGAIVISEMLQGLNDEEDPQEVIDPIVVASIRKAKPKTIRQKKKRKLARLAKPKELLKKQAVATRGDLSRLDKIVEEVAEYEKKLKENAEKRAKQLIMKAYMTRRIGRGKYEPPIREFQLPSETADSLRTLQVEGNLLRDRLDSYRKRNIIPCWSGREKSKSRRKPKRTKKPSIQQLNSYASSLL